MNYIYFSGRVDSIDERVEKREPFVELGEEYKLDEDAQQIGLVNGAQKQVEIQRRRHYFVQTVLFFFVYDLLLIP